jgi:hypothetical protein
LIVHVEIGTLNRSAGGLPSMPTTPAKRQKEKNRQDRQRDKEKRRELRRHQRANMTRPTDGEDPDIAGIVPGPQPPRED